MKIEIQGINNYQLEVLVEDKRFILTDLRKVKVKKRNRNIVLTVLFMVLFILCTCIFLNKDEGHYEADYIKDGVLYDINGDGNYYHWVEPID